MTDLLGDSLAGTAAVAWSGGLDSTVLLDLCRRVERVTELEVAAMHVDHQLGPESDDRASFCRRTAARRGIPLAVETIAPVEEAASLEAQLRMQRYAALGDAARRLGADAVLTAHHANDAVETALLRFLRGTGASGFADLAPGRPITPAEAPGPIAGWPALPIGRPLLAVDREDLETYAETRQLAWRTDPANASPDQTRNRLRREVVPALEREAGSLAPMLRTLDNIADDARALEEHVDELVERARRPAPSAESVALSPSALTGAAGAEITSALRRLGAELPSPPRWTRERLDASLRAIEAVRSGEADRRTITLGGGRLTVEPDLIVLSRTRSRGGCHLDERRALPVAIDVETPGRTRWFDHRLEWRSLEPSDPTNVPTDSTIAWFDADRLPDHLVLRGPSAGESIHPFGLTGDKSVADILREGDVPGSRRWRWPCLAPSDEQSGDCLWVVGLRQAQRAAISEETTRVLEIRARTSCARPTLPSG